MNCEVKMLKFCCCVIKALKLLRQQVQNITFWQQKSCKRTIDDETGRVIFGVRELENEKEIVKGSNCKNNPQFEISIISG